MKKLTLFLFLLLVSFGTFADAQTIRTTLPRYVNALPEPNTCDVNNKKQALIVVKNGGQYQCIGGAYVKTGGGGVSESAESADYPSLESLVGAKKTALTITRMTTDLSCSSSVTIAATMAFEAAGGKIVRNAGCRIEFLGAGLENPMADKPLFSGFTAKADNGSTRSITNLTTIYSNEQPFTSTDAGRFIYIPELNYQGTVVRYIDSRNITVSPAVPQAFTLGSFTLSDIRFSGSEVSRNISSNLVEATTLDVKLNVLDHAFAGKKITIHAFEGTTLTRQVTLTPFHTLYFEAGDFPNTFNGAYEYDPNNHTHGKLPLVVYHSNTKITGAGRTLTTIRESVWGNRSVKVFHASGAAEYPYTAANENVEISHLSIKESFGYQKRTAAANGTAGSFTLTVTGANFRATDIGARIYFLNPATPLDIRNYRPVIAAVINPATVELGYENSLTDRYPIPAGGIVNQDVEWDKNYSLDNPAIYLGNAKNGYVHDVYFEYVHGFAVYAGASGLDGNVPTNCYITDNIIKGAHSQMIGAISGKNILIARNFVDTARRKGISYIAVFDVEPSTQGDSIDQVFIENNYITMVNDETPDGADGIVVQQAEGLSVRNITVKNNTVIGGNLVTDSSIADNVKCRTGIAVSGAIGGDISGNTVQGCGQIGLYLEGGLGVHVKGNFITMTGGDSGVIEGARLYSMVDSYFENNTVTPGLSISRNGVVGERNTAFVKVQNPDPANDYVKASGNTITTQFGYFKQYLVGRRIMIGGTFDYNTNTYSYDGQIYTVASVDPGLQSLTLTSSTGLVNEKNINMFWLVNSVTYKGNTITNLRLAPYSQSKIIGGFTETYARDFTPVSNAAGTETTLKSYTLDERNFRTNNPTISIKAQGTFSGSASTDKRLRVKFLSSTIFDTGNLAIASANWRTEIEIYTTNDARTSGKAVVKFFTDAASLPSKTTMTDITLPASGAMAFEITGQGTLANDVTANLFRIWKEDLH